MYELKKLLDENKKQLSDMLQNCPNGTAEQTLLGSKMGALLAEFTEIEEELFSLPSVQNDPASQKDPT